MSKTSFDELVQREQRVSQSGHDEKEDWLRERDEWLRYLDELYVQVEGFLGDYVQTSAVKIAFKPIELNEDHIGSYPCQ